MKSFGISLNIVVVVRDGVEVGLTFRGWAETFDEDPRTIIFIRLSLNKNDVEDEL